MVKPWELHGVAPPPVLILGMHNSGTTMLAEILHRCGLFLGNNAAHCESHFFTLFINDRLIMGGGDAWARLPILSVEEVLRDRDVIRRLILDNWRMDYVQWGYDGFGPWGIKDPRLCVVLPLYLDVFPDARLLLIRRNPDDIAASLAHRYKPGVGVKNDPAHWRQLTLAHLQRVEQCAQGRSDYYEVAYEELCRDPITVARPLFEYLRLPFNQRAEDTLGQIVRSDRIGTQHWPESRWRWEKTKERLKYLFGPLYNAARGRG